MGPVSSLLVADCDRRAAPTAARGRAAPAATRDGTPDPSLGAEGAEGPCPSTGRLLASRTANAPPSQAWAARPRGARSRLAVASSLEQTAEQRADALSARSSRATVRVRSTYRHVACNV